MEDRISIQSLNPEYIYEEAIKNIPSIKSNALKLKSSKYAWNAARGGLLPQLSLSGQLGSNWTSTYKQYDGFTIDGTCLLYTSRCV